MIPYRHWTIDNPREFMTIEDEVNNIFMKEVQNAVSRINKRILNDGAIYSSIIEGRKRRITPR